MQYLHTPLELLDVKADSSGDMSFTAYASTFGNVDHGGDVVEKGAFKATLQNTNRNRPLLWQHDPRSPIGIEKAIKEDGKGLLGTWQILDTQQGLDAYKLMKAGAVRAMSIGYLPKTWEWQKEGEVRLIKEIDLLENSVVSIPMNDQARIQSVKEIREIVAETIKELHGDPGRATAFVTSNAVDLSLSEHARIATELHASLGERCVGLLEKLKSGDFDLTEAKRAELQAYLEMFSSQDVVRRDVEAVLAHKPTTDPPTAQSAASTISALALAIQLRKQHARRRGIDV